MFKRVHPVEALKPLAEASPLMSRPGRGSLSSPSKTPPFGDAGARARESEQQASSSVHQVLQSTGQALDTGARDYFEPRFGHDFAEVRVHAGERAAEAARSVNALAFTVGRDIVFGEGQYAPASSEGRALLAHELVHVLQQRQSGSFLARKRCGHDGSETKCGAGTTGRIAFESGDNEAIDAMVVGSMRSRFGGRWAGQVATPPLAIKAGKDRGYVDGLKVNAGGTALRCEVIEVKARSSLGGGCDKASVEARAYVAELKSISPRLPALSRAAQQLGKLHSKYSLKTGQVLAKEGIDLSRYADAKAHTFYLSLLNKMPDLAANAYDTFEFALNTDGITDTSYKANAWMVDCPKSKKPGVRTLNYQVNQLGGVSYGCETECEEEEKERRKKPKEMPVEVPKSKEEPAADKAPTSFLVHPDYDETMRWVATGKFPAGRIFELIVPIELVDAVEGARRIKNFIRMTNATPPAFDVHNVIYQMRLVSWSIIAGALSAEVAIAIGLLIGAAIPVAAATPVASVATTGGVVLPFVPRVVAIAPKAAEVVTKAAAAVILASVSAEAEAQAAVSRALVNKACVGALDMTGYEGTSGMGERRVVGGKVYVVMGVFGTH